MADQSLQAFQLGASLFDRAQTQQRLMEQFQLNAADQVMRQRQYDLQNKIQTKAYEDALKESEAQNSEFDTFQTFNDQIAAFLNNPDIEGQIPTVPRFKSKIFNQEAQRAVQGLQQYSPRAKLLKAREKYDADRANNAADMLSVLGVDVFDPKTGQINEELYRRYLPMIPLKGYGQEVRAAFSQTDPNLPFDQRIGEAIKMSKERAKTAGERSSERNAQLAVDEYTNLFGKPDSFTKSFIENNALSGKWTIPPATQAKQIEGDERIAGTTSTLVDELNSFEQKYGKNALQPFVGIIDGRVSEIQKKLSGAKTDKEREAYALLQRFQDNFNKAAFEQSGKAVTTSEMQRLVAALGSIKSDNFSNDVRNFAKMSAEDLHRTINNFKSKYRITPEQVQLADDLKIKYKLINLPLFQTTIPSGIPQSSMSQTQQTNQIGLPPNTTPITANTPASGWKYNP